MQNTSRIHYRKKSLTPRLFIIGFPRYPLRFSGKFGSREPAAVSAETAYNNIALYDNYGVIHGNSMQ